MIYRVIADTGVVGTFDHIEQASDVAREYAAEYGHCELLDETGKRLFSFESDVPRQYEESEAVNNAALQYEECSICGDDLPIDVVGVCKCCSMWIDPDDAVI